ncbi:hypothetical protein QN398_27335, partial [Pseudomonas sp. CCC2.2]
SSAASDVYKRQSRQVQAQYGFADMAEQPGSGACTAHAVPLIAQAPCVQGLSLIHIGVGGVGV